MPSLSGSRSCSALLSSLLDEALSKVERGVLEISGNGIVYLERVLNILTWHCRVKSKSKRLRQPRQCDNMQIAAHPSRVTLPPLESGKKTDSDWVKISIASLVTYSLARSMGTLWICYRGHLGPSCPKSKTRPKTSSWDGQESPTRSRERVEVVQNSRS